jgi:hypothetical protein
MSDNRYYVNYYYVNYTEMAAKLVFACPLTEYRG